VPDTTDLYPTLTRRKLLRAVEHHRVVAANGVVLWHTDGGYSHRCDAKIRELEAAGWVLLGVGGVYELTDDGRAVLDGAR
jgi:hypothetical protein